MKNKRVYISLPIGDDKTFQKKQEEFAWETVKKLSKYGYIGVNPFHNGLSENATRKMVMRKDFSMLLECDMVLLCPGYEDSEGCQQEITLAIWSGIRVVHYHDFFG